MKNKVLIVSLILLVCLIILGGFIGVNTKAYFRVLLPQYEKELPQVEYFDFKTTVNLTDDKLILRPGTTKEFDFIIESLETDIDLLNVTYEIEVILNGELFEEMPLDITLIHNGNNVNHTNSGNIIKFNPISPDVMDKIDDFTLKILWKLSPSCSSKKATLGDIELNVKAIQNQ